MKTHAVWCWTCPTSQDPRDDDDDDHYDSDDLDANGADGSEAAAAPVEQSPEGVAPDQPRSTPGPAASSGPESTPVAAVSSPSSGAGLGSRITPLFLYLHKYRMPICFLHVQVSEYVGLEKRLGSYLSYSTCVLMSHAGDGNNVLVPETANAKLEQAKKRLEELGTQWSWHLYIFIYTYIVDRFVSDMDAQSFRYICLTSSWPMKHVCQSYSQPRSMNAWRSRIPGFV